MCRMTHSLCKLVSRFRYVVLLVSLIVQSALVSSFVFRHDANNARQSFSGVGRLRSHENNACVEVEDAREPSGERVGGGSYSNGHGTNRRSMMRTATTLTAGTAASWLLPPNDTAWASSSKSRTEGYAVQRTEREWAYVLSGQQYNILRQGGTERPNSSILESEDRPGTFVCAGCGTPLFESSQKFHSGTGWPSFASGLKGVEVERVNPVQANLLGAELRCGTCGGHLGDVFSDGKLFVNTPAFVTGKRLCIDGAALIFKPEDASAEEVFGDLPPPASKNGDELPAFLRPPEIKPKS